jgi:hypothetical protein
MTMEKKIDRLQKEIQKNNNGETIEFVIPGYAAKKIVAYQSMREDLLLCRESIKELLSGQYNETIMSSLFYTTIILYGKCFTDSTSSKSSKLELSDFGDGNEDLIQFHQEIMDMRHNFVAHRGSTDHDFGLPYMSLWLNDLSVEIKVRQLKRIKFADKKIFDYSRLIEYLIKVVEDKFSKAGEKVFSHLFESFTVDQLMSFLIATPRDNK